MIVRAGGILCELPGGQGAEGCYVRRMGTPRQPDSETRERLLGVIAELIAKCGARPFLLRPVAPGRAAFPEAWAPTSAGVQLLLRRLMWYAGVDRGIELDDDRMAKAPPTERKPATRVELTEVGTETTDNARFTLYFIGGDDVAGTLAHEVGTLFAALHRSDKTDPYRSAEPPVIAIDPDRDLERGSIATVYLGLGVLAANAAFQQYSSPGRFNGGYVPLEYDVLQAGALPMSALADLLAVQAVVRGDGEPPKGLSPPQRDEVAQWMKTLDGQREALRDRLGIAASEEAGERPEVEPLPDEPLPVEEPAPRPLAFRWHTHRGGIGFVAGSLMGMGIAFVLSRGLMPITMVGGATAGHVIGRRVRAPRCSACATVVSEDATTCPSCGAVLRGDIANLADRLEAEERLEEEGREQV